MRIEEKPAKDSEKIAHHVEKAPHHSDHRVHSEKGKQDQDKEADQSITISSQTLLIGFLVLLAVGLVVWRIQSPSPPPSGAPSQSQQGTDEAVARVNGEEIMRSEIQHQIDKIPLQLKAKVSFEEILNSTIKERILLQEAKRLGIEVSKPEAGAYLAMMMNSSGISKDDLEKRAKDKGISESEIMNIVQRRLVINNLLQQNVFSTVKINDEEVQKFYGNHKQELSIPEMVHAKHILLSQSEEANATLNRLKKGGKGADFESLAKDLSLDKGSAANGGDLGNFTKGMMVPEFEKAAFDAKPGDLVGPVKTAFGYHIIKVFSHSKGRERPFKEIEDAIKRKLKADKTEAAANAFAEDLKRNATIELLMKK